MSVSTKATLKPIAPKLSQETPNHLQRNFWLGVISGGAYHLYITMLSTELVMTWFLSELTDSNLLISLLIPIELGSWCFLQLLLSGYVQRQPRAMPLYWVMAAIRLASTGLLSLAVFTLDGPGVLLLVTLAMFTANHVAAGVAALPFLNIVAKTIPPTRRGIYFGWRRFSGGLLGLFGGVLVKVILAPDFMPFPNNYALIFFLGFLSTAVLVGSFSFIVEPEEVADSQRVSLIEQLRRAIQLPARDRNYGRYLGIRAAITVSNYALPFYAVYARRALNAPEDTVGIYLIGATLASVLFNLISGRIGDRYGNRLLVRLSAWTAALPPLMALLIVYLPEMGLDKILFFTLVFVFRGLHTTVSSIGNNPYVMELVPSIQRVLYLGFANGVVGLVLFASPLGGAIVDWLGFESLFLFSLACSLIAVALSLGLQEPRQKQVKAIT
jgi:hypothetical protein